MTICETTSPAPSHPLPLLPVINAQYDHLGVRGGTIYDGVNDDASGPSTQFSIGKYFSGIPLCQTSLITIFRLFLGSARSVAFLESARKKAAIGRPLIFSLAQNAI